MTRPAWIAVDWGTSNLRAWAMDAGGSVLDERQSADGMGTLAADGFEPALLRLIEAWDVADGTKVIACGMVGARQGWTEAGYAHVPATPLGRPLAPAPTTDPRLDVLIVPGLDQADPPDVMRGEETQVAGFLALNPGFDGTLCLPGSHTKWVQVSAGEVVSFQTAMTGEIFAALSQHTILRHTLTADWDDDAFREAVSDGMSRPEALAARAFRLRAEAMVSGAASTDASARLSGLLIGAELAHARPYWLGMAVGVIGEARLAARYADALAAQGCTAIRARGDACTLAGLAAARKAATS